jgi:ABC-type molybdenum transport system ATPase subunit/photorepair protein PhrA
MPPKMVTRHGIRTCYQHRATYSSHVVRIPTANVYRFGDPNNAKPVLRALDWTVREGESWAVVGSGAGEKTALLEVGHLLSPHFLFNRFVTRHSLRSPLPCHSLTWDIQTLLGNMRISPPPPGGPLPSLALKSRPINEAISFVSFAHRPRASGGAFYDYTARYGAVREEDRITLRQSMFPKESGLAQESIKSSLADKMQTKTASQTEERAQRFEELIEKLELIHLLDLPFVALSNGQTRRARIVKALLEQPDVLLLDEPLSEFWLIFYIYIQAHNSSSWT